MNIAATFAMCGLTWNLYLSKNFKEECLLVTDPRYCAVFIKCPSLKHKMICSTESGTLAEADVLRTDSGNYAGYLECVDKDLYQEQSNSFRKNK